MSTFTTFPLRTTMDEYSRTAAEVPHYPNVTKFSTRRLTSRKNSEEMGCIFQKEQMNNQNGEKVQIIEKVIEYDKNVNCTAYEKEAIRTATDELIHGRRKAFELCKTLTL